MSWLANSFGYFFQKLDDLFSKHLVTLPSNFTFCLFSTGSDQIGQFFANWATFEGSL
jgi:hypothetical protein